MILVAAGEDSHPVGQQRRGDGVAGMSAVTAAVEGELDGRRAIDDLARLGRQTARSPARLEFDLTRGADGKPLISLVTEWRSTTK